jgi:hypothetical protein
MSLSQKCSFLLVIMVRVLWTEKDVDPELILDSNSDEAVLSDSEIKLGEDTAAMHDNSNVGGS